MTQLLKGMWFFCVHAKSLQLCPTLCDPMNCSPPDFLYPWDFPDKNTGVGCHFLLQGISQLKDQTCHLLCLLHWQTDTLPLAPQYPYFRHIFIYLGMYLNVHKAWANHLKFESASSPSSNVMIFQNLCQEAGFFLAVAKWWGCTSSSPESNFKSGWNEQK